MQRFLAPAFAAGLFCVLLPSPLTAQSPFATTVVAYEQGAGGGLFDPALALGGPQGGGLSQGSLDVLTLGEGGRVTLGFAGVIADGPGADLTVFENAFAVSGGPATFAEIAHVEVSSDGVAFARFPSRYAGTGTDMGAFRGLCGGMPTLADVTTGAIDPLDPALSGGEALDLADLAQDPAVLAGAVDLAAIRFVRIADVQAGDADALGTPLPPTGSADVDAVAVLNAALDPAQPICDLYFDAEERLHLVVGDPDGFLTLDPTALHATFDLAPVPLDVLLGAFDVASVSATELHLVTPPLAGAGLTGALGLSARDASGRRSGDQAMVQR